MTSVQWLKSHCYCILLFNLLKCYSNFCIKASVLEFYGHKLTLAIKAFYVLEKAVTIEGTFKSSRRKLLLRNPGILELFPFLALFIAAPDLMKGQGRGRERQILPRDMSQCIP